MSDIRVDEVARFQAYLDGLAEPFGAEVGFVRTQGGDRMHWFSAGVRVLSATPIFSRATGEVERWRYWLLFAEMSILDRLGCGHPVHAFECDVREQREYVIRLQDVGGAYTISVCRNDPHHLEKRQESIYAAWDDAVKDAGGKAAYQALLDGVAKDLTNDLLATGEMKR